MTIHIISDNQFFLVGISNRVTEEPAYYDSHLIKVYDLSFSTDEILPTDIVVIFIHNKTTRMKILRLLTSISNNIVIMVDSLFEQALSLSYPLRICSKSTLQEIIGVRKEVKRTHLPGRVSERTYNIFSELYKGTSMDVVVDALNLNLFNIYNMKKRIFNRFGLKNINDKGVLHCMEYLEMSMMANNIRHK